VGSNGRSGRRLIRKDSFLDPPMSGGFYEIILAALDRDFPDDNESDLKVRGIAKSTLLCDWRSLYRWVFYRTGSIDKAKETVLAEIERYIDRCSKGGGNDLSGL